MGRIEKRKKAFESARKIMSKVLETIFTSGQNWGHQRSKKVKNPDFWTCIQTLPSISGTMIARTNPKKGIESSWNARSVICPQIWPQVNSLGSRGHQRSKLSFFRKNVFANNFLSKKARELSLSPLNFSRQAGSNGIFDAFWYIWCFWRWGHLRWPGDLTWHDLRSKLTPKVRNECPVR